MAIPKKKPAKKAATKKKAPAAGPQDSVSKKVTAKKKAPAKKKTAAKKVTKGISAKIKNKALPESKKVIAKKSTVSKKKIEDKNVIAPIIESPDSIKQKDTIRKNIAIDEHEAEIVRAEQLSSPVPVTEEKQGKNMFFKKTKGLRAIRNYDPHHIQLNKVKKGGPKPSGKKPLW